MTQQQVEDRIALALRQCSKLDDSAVRLILHEKAEVIRRTGLLEYRDPPEGGLERIGGCLPDSFCYPYRLSAQCILQ